MATVDEKNALLVPLDPILASHGFRRSKRSQEWKRKSDDRYRDYVHVNFGLAVVHPSIGVMYLDLVSMLPPQAGPVTNSHVMLSSLVPGRPFYNVEISPVRLADDVVSYGLARIERLHDREFVANSLASSEVAQWCTISYSHRIRLLPLILASLDRVPEALATVQLFTQEASLRDQIIPRYEVFAQFFSARFAT
jgi:hypothetical protein